MNELKCADCDAKITEKVAKFSADVYNKELCMKCQAKEKQKKLSETPKDKPIGKDVVTTEEPKTEFTGVDLEEPVKTSKSFEKPEWATKMEQSDVKGNYFIDLMKVQGNVAKKGPLELNYISWANAWAEVKKVHHDANFIVYENNEGMPYFYNNHGGFVKVGTVIGNIEHVVWLPIMDYNNKSILSSNITTFDVNKAIQRALAKGLAMHGFGLYVYQGEDHPEK